MFDIVQRLRKALNPPLCVKSTTEHPLRFGILGAAAIAPAAIIGPACSHPEVVVYAVAARSLGKATRFARKHHVAKVYGGDTAYQELLDDPLVDAVYNPLPNGLHYEWTMKALNAGKHVLLEKPSANTAAETREMFALAKKKGLVLLEAFHYRFHPAVQRCKEIVASGECGAVKHVEVSLAIPRGIMGPEDIRFNLALGGGAMMDMGCYTIDCMRYITGAEPLSVIAATADVFSEGIDAGTTATLAFPGDVTGTLSCHLRMPPRFGFIPAFPQVHVRAECEAGEVMLFNFVMPTIYHYIEVKVKSRETGKVTSKRVEKVYKPRSAEWKGEDWWTTYRYQLEAFVDTVRGRRAVTWLSEENAVADMEWIERVYDKTGLGSRPASAFKFPGL